VTTRFATGISQGDSAEWQKLVKVWFHMVDDTFAPANLNDAPI
jgi:hypothetical protein